MSLLTCVLSAFALSSAPMPAQPPVAVYLADHPYLIASSQQGWGELGLNTCAHAAGVHPLPLQIGDHVYAHGLGHHAPGDIVLDLEGRYATFKAEVGVQRQPTGAGSVVFRVYVDGRKRFDSGVLHETDAPRPIRVDLRGAEELRLAVTDAGDGILCDCADWADARVTPDPSARRRPALPAFDVAPFARVVTSDPARMDGARASRIQEFRAADLFLETDILARRDGSHAVPIQHRRGCIGLQWLERRKLKSAGIVFAGAAPRTEPRVQAQVWVGESASQGRWIPLVGTVQRQGSRWMLQIDPVVNPDAWKGVCKLRWVIPNAPKGLRVTRLVALTTTPTAAVRLWLRGSGAVSGRRVRVAAYNGQVLAPSPGAARHPRPSGAREARPNTGPLAPAGRGVPEGRGEGVRLRLSHAPVAITVRYTRPRPWKCDRTVLRFSLPTGAVSVAVDDVMARGVVWAPSRGLTVSLPDRKAPARRGSTVLERVRRMPDQTLAQAMKRTRNPIQDLGPMMLSLACDNRKFVAEREGTVRSDMVGVMPSFGASRKPDPARYTRHLAGGWLPALVTATTEGGVTYVQRTYVAPTTTDRLRGAGWHEEHPVCVVEITLRNGGAAPREAALHVALALGENGVGPIAWSNRGATAEAIAATRILCLADTRDAGQLAVAFDGAAMHVTGALAPGEARRVRFLLPTEAIGHAAGDALLARADLFARMQAHWNRVLAPAARIELPDRFVTNVIRASQVHCMIATRNEANGARYEVWASAPSYGALESESHSPIRGMDLMGNHDYARRGLDYFIHRYNPAGYLTTGYTLMGSGWHLQTLGEHYALTHDRAWMRRVSPKVARLCAWIVRQREKTMRPRAAVRAVSVETAGSTGRAGTPVLPIRGLMPPGVMADWNAFAFYFCLNGYYCAGLREAGRALAALGLPDGRRYERESALMAGDILRAYRWTQARTPVVPLQDGTWTTAGPSQVYVTGPTNDFFAGEDSNRSWAYDVELGAHQLVPQGVIPANSAECERIMNRMEDSDFLSDGWFDYPGEQSRRDWFNRGGFSKVQPYYCRNAEIYALRDDVKPFVRSYFNTLAAMVNTENLSFWEHFHNGGAWNKTHETGYFLQQSRSMLAMERGSTLVLAPLVPSTWLRPGATIAVHNLPTRFGPVSYRIDCARSGRRASVTIVAPRRHAPARITLRLRTSGGLRHRSVVAHGSARRRLKWNASEVAVVRPVGIARFATSY